MFDFGWSELFLILVLGIVLIGPKDIPELVYQAGRFVRRLQYMKFALTRQFDDFMEKVDLKDITDGTYSTRIAPGRFITPLPGDVAHRTDTAEAEDDHEFHEPQIAPNSEIDKDHV